MGLISSDPVVGLGVSDVVWYTDGLHRAIRSWVGDLSERRNMACTAKGGKALDLRERQNMACPVG